MAGFPEEYWYTDKNYLKLVNLPLKTAMNTGIPGKIILSYTDYRYKLSEYKLIVKEIRKEVLVALRTLIDL